MASSFRTGLVIEQENSNIIGGYDYMETENHFVIKYAVYDNKSLPQEAEQVMLYLKQENEGWIIGKIVDGQFHILDHEVCVKIKKHILSEHYFHNRIFPSKLSINHSSVKDLKAIA